MIISIFASIGSGNLGDELILKNEISLLEKRFKDKNPKFIVFSYDLENIFYYAENVEYKEYFPVGIKNPKNIFRNIKNYFSFIKVVKNSDLVVVGGGGIFYDNEKQSVGNPLKQWYFRSVFFKIFKKKVFFLAVGLNIINKKNYSIIKYIFKDAYELTVRDKYSHNLLKDLGIKSSIVDDPVFYDKKGVSSKGNLEKNLIIKINVSSYLLDDLNDIELEGKTIGLAFRSGYFKNEILEINNLIDYLLVKKAKIVLLPHSFHKTDSLANDYIFLEKFLGKKGVSIKKTEKEVYEVYKKLKIDICFSMRLHSMILSTVYSIPFVAFSYSKKTDELLK